MIPQTILGPTGRSVTRLGLGGEGVLRTYGQDEAAAAVISAALAGGITYLESARAYSGSERYYGASLPQSRRAELFVASKAHDRTKQGARAMLEATLKAMRLDYLDLWQLHDVREFSELDELEDPSAAYAAFDEAKRAGLVKAIGVTGHHDPAVLRAALERFAFDTVLLPVNPAEAARGDSFERSVIPAARARGMGVVGMKCFARGLLFDRRAGGVSIGEAINFALSADVDAVVIGCDSPAQVHANIEAAQRFAALSEAERSAIAARVTAVAGNLSYYRAEALHG